MDQKAGLPSRLSVRLLSTHKVLKSRPLDIERALWKGTSPATMYRCCCGLPFFQSRFEAPESPPHPHHHRPREVHDEHHHHHHRHGPHHDGHHHPHHRHHEQHHGHHAHRDRSRDIVEFVASDPVVVEEIPVSEEAPAPVAPEPVEEQGVTPPAAPIEEAPDPNADVKALAWEAEGFGRHARGGFDGSIYVVTSLEGDLHCLSLTFAFLENLLQGRSLSIAARLCSCSRLDIQIGAGRAS